MTFPYFGRMSSSTEAWRAKGRGWQAFLRSSKMLGSNCSGFTVWVYGNSFKFEVRVRFGV